MGRGQYPHDDHEDEHSMIPAGRVFENQVGKSGNPALPN